jgi:hypothetical protein
MLLPKLHGPVILLLKDLSKSDFGARCCGFPLIAPNNTALRMGHPTAVVLPTLETQKSSPSYQHS